jgi:GntR family transcriptional regulator
MLQTMHTPVDRDDPAPLHHQVRRALLALINELNLKPGDQLPPEHVLWERFQVSRQTLRQAVEFLVRDHVLYRQRPKGTFVGFGAVEGDLRTLRSVWEDLRRLGMEPTVRVLSMQKKEAGEIAPFLEVRPDSRVLELRRVFVVGRGPISLDTAYFPLPEFEWLADEQLDGSWYELLKVRRGIALSHARTVIDAMPAIGMVATHLDVAEGAALLRLRRQTYAQGGGEGERPIAYTAALYCGDRYQFSVVLPRH